MIADSAKVALAACTALALVAGALAACGPSFQVVYEGDARFEHCYAIDDTPTVPMQEKSDCWTQWMTNYTYGQTRNRVDYAAMRAKALREVPALPTDEALMSAAPGGGTGRDVGHDVPVTTNAFAPPPTTLSGDAGQDAPGPTSREGTTAEAHAAGAPVVPLAPHDGCILACRAKWQACTTACKVKCVDCDPAYSGCMRRCF